MAFVGVAAVEDGAFDLDAAEAAAVVGDEVVRGGVSPGLGSPELQWGIKNAAFWGRGVFLLSSSILAIWVG